MRFTLPFRCIALLSLLLAAADAHARIGLVVGEPFGSFGTMMPMGHAGVYLDHICPDTPLRVRACRPGEPGAVVSRFHDLHHPSYDWIAMPVLPFFYGVDDVAKVPRFLTPELIASLRENYRQQHLLSAIPDQRSHGRLQPPPYGDWNEAIGASFDRRLLVYVIDTTPQQDAAILAYLNDRPNTRRYTLRRANCADFAADLLSIVLPGAPHRAVLADFDMTAPKTLARQVDDYGHAHPETHLEVYEVPQLPGSVRRSRPLRGAAEGVITTKRYLVTVLVLQPELLLADWIVYAKGKWKPGLDAVRRSPADWTTSSSAQMQAHAAENPSRDPEDLAAPSIQPE